MMSLSLSQERAQEQVQVKFKYQEYHQFEFQEEINSFNINDKQLIIFFNPQNKKLILINLNRQKQVKQVILKQKEKDNVIIQIDQSFNQKLLFLIDALGKVIILRNDGHYKQMNQIRFKYRFLLCLKQLDSSQIITAHVGGYIIITDIILRKQLFQVQTQKFDLFQIEYDSINSVILTVADDKSILFFKLNGEKIIDQQNAHKYSQITIFLTTDNNLISASIDDLKLWNIDYNNKHLTLLKCIENGSLAQLKQTVDKKNFILIDENHIKFIDHNLDLEQYKHLFQYICFYYNATPQGKLHISNNFIAVLCQEKNIRWINILKKLT